jgi:Mn2+/Fe2+ NRAMP family transporter
MMKSISDLTHALRVKDEFILILLVIITQNKDLMGKYKLGKATLALALAAIVITTILFLASIASML